MHPILARFPADPIALVAQDGQVGCSQEVDRALAAEGLGKQARVGEMHNAVTVSVAGLESHREGVSRRGRTVGHAAPGAVRAGGYAGVVSGDASLPLKGGCGCGAVRFEITAPLVGALYCHCTRCQRRTGTASSANGRTAPGSFRVVAGEEYLSTWTPEGGSEKVFCARCGSALFSRSGDGTVIGVRLGNLDADPGIRPQWHQYVDYRAPWQPLPDDGLPRYPEARPA